MQKVDWNEKKFLETLQVAKKFASNLWKALGKKGEWGRGGGGCEATQ